MFSCNSIYKIKSLNEETKWSNDDLFAVFEKINILCFFDKIKYVAYVCMFVRMNVIGYAYKSLRYWV